MPYIAPLVRNHLPPFPTPPMAFLLLAVYSKSFISLRDLDALN